MISSFKKFKNDFYSKFSDLSIFDGEDFNFFKVVLEGLKVNYYARGKFLTTIFYSNFFYKILLFLIRCKKNINGELSRYKFHLSIINKHKNPDYLIIDPGRVIKNSKDQLIPIYFSKIHNQLKKNHAVFYISEKENKNFNGFHDTYSDLKTLGNSITHPNSPILRKELLNVFNNIKKYTNFSLTDLENIKCAFEKFFVEALFWLNILELLNPKEILMICHYHKEGLIYAAKKLNIKIIEYQHGLIAKSDIFYNFPKEVLDVKNDCLFPDEIRTFGEYWKSILLKGNFISENQIKVVDYYIYNRSTLSHLEFKKLNEFCKKRKVILITTQTFLTDIYINYIDILIQILEDSYCVIIKTHPQESILPYKKYKNNSVFLTDISVDLLLKKSDFHLTIYSTTAFDAIKYGLPTYFIYDESQSQYIYEIYNAIGGVILKDFKKKPWDIQNEIEVNTNSFFSAS